MGLSVSQFHERFQQHMGLPPAQWRTRQRIARAKALLRQGDASITSIALSLGFDTSQYFRTVFKRYVGFTPANYRKRHGVASVG